MDKEEMVFREEYKWREQERWSGVEQTTEREIVKMGDGQDVLRTCEEEEDDGERKKTEEEENSMTSEGPEAKTKRISCRRRK